ncbi:YbhB/YbcL family Raf kinase inhibitor-like protein [Caulobacter sp. S45]|uniref:YbhB/YbcL family Raf kinase inhibitor-like protein n=1 Tax=Caulobacter sp. S45 TaxID=1641861 RepID=UPI00131ABC84|nr:YbhB/YbcL family Raf kinase inhibitor-like protein [Caulobacter sp. S45]
MNGRLSLTAAAALSLALVTGAAAQGDAPVDLSTQIAVFVLPANSGKTLKVSSPAFAPGGDIPFVNTQYRGNVFPGLAWTAGPKGTRAYAIIMQDPDSPYHGGPLVHWTMFDIPAGMTRLPAAMTVPPEGSQYGPNPHGSSQPYHGPRTPPGPKHHYHFQVFALDAALPLNPDVDYETLASEMKGHILASGDLVGLSFADPDAPPPKPKG